MKQAFILLWLIAPVGLLAFHYGPGRRYEANDAAADRIQQAIELSAAAQETGSIEDWTKAIETYESALEMIPEENEETRARTRLAIARARMGQGDLIQALIDLEALLDEERRTPRSEGLEEEIRETLARDEYFIAWRMRLDGDEIQAWRCEADNARRYFRYLAESQEKRTETASSDASASGRLNDSGETSLIADAGTDGALPDAGDLSDREGSVERERGVSTSEYEKDDRFGKDLEASVRMMMMDVDMLRALPLPPEVQNSQGRGVGQGVAKQRGDGQGEGEGEDEGEGEGEGDARSRGATAGERPEGIGS